MSQIVPSLLENSAPRTTCKSGLIATEDDLGEDMPLLETFDAPNKGTKKL